MLRPEPGTVDLDEQEALRRRLLSVLDKLTSSRYVNTQLLDRQDLHDLSRLHMMLERDADAE